MIVQKAFEVEVRIEKPGNGILVAQGGDAHGWGLSLENGILRFFVCLNGKGNRDRQGETEFQGFESHGKTKLFR